MIKYPKGASLKQGKWSSTYVCSRAWLDSQVGYVSISAVARKRPQLWSSIHWLVKRLKLSQVRGQERCDNVLPQFSSTERDYITHLALGLSPCSTPSTNF